MKKIESTTNKSIKWVKKLLSDSKQRKIENLAVVETIKIFNEIPPKDIEAIFCTNEFYSFHKNKLNRFGDRINLCTNQIFNSLSNLKNPDGILAVIKQTENKIVFDKNKNYLALYNLQNPNNLGAIIRSALAFGIAGIYLIGNCVDLYHPEVIRSSMGYVFKMPFEKYNSFDYFLAYAKKNNMVLLAADNSNKAISIYDYKQFNGNCFIIGNEGHGMEETVLKQCDVTIRIPLQNNVESLNASVAASVIAFYLNHENN